MEIGLTSDPWHHRAFSLQTTAIGCIFPPVRSSTHRPETTVMWQQLVRCSDLQAAWRQQPRSPPSKSLQSPSPPPAPTLSEVVSSCSVCDWLNLPSPALCVKPLLLFIKWQRAPSFRISLRIQGSFAGVSCRKAQPERRVGGGATAGLLLKTGRMPSCSAGSRCYVTVMSERRAKT